MVTVELSEHLVGFKADTITSCGSQSNVQLTRMVPRQVHGTHTVGDSATACGNAPNNCSVSSMKLISVGYRSQSNPTQLPGHPTFAEDSGALPVNFGQTCAAVGHEFDVFTAPRGHAVHASGPHLSIEDAEIVSHQPPRRRVRFMRTPPTLSGAARSATSPRTAL
jgi:hypothetical protein